MSSHACREKPSPFKRRSDHFQCLGREAGSKNWYATTKSGDERRDERDTGNDQPDADRWRHRRICHRGAVGATFYPETSATEEVDIFVMLPVGRGAFAEGVRAGQCSIKILLEACFVRPFVIAGKISVAAIFADALGRNGMQLDRTEV